jgi:hypothetical protein
MGISKIRLFFIILTITSRVSAIFIYRVERKTPGGGKLDRGVK